MFGRNRHGWIGVDLGGRAIKIAQLRRVGDGLCLSAAAVNERSTGSLRNDLRGVKALAECLQGARAAATLTMATCQVEPTDDETPVPKDRCSDQWTAGAALAYTLSAPAEQVESAVDQMSQAGLRCEVIDGSPLAIARALQLVDGYQPDELMLALDWGETAATVVAAKGGVVHYTRRLTGSSFAEVRRQTAEALGLTPVAASRIISRVGIAKSPTGSPPIKPDEKLVANALKSAMRPTAQEVERTLEHVGSKLRSPPPTRCFMIGAGGAIPGLAAAFGEVISIPTEPWTAGCLQRDPALPDVADCLLAQAIALSALAWDATH